VAQHRYPNYPADTANGDDPSFSPQKTAHSLLGTERGSDSTKRLETDPENNLYVHVAADDTTGTPGMGGGVSPLAVGAATAVPASTLTTIVTHTAAVAQQVTKISCGGMVYAKYQLFLNTTLIDTRRSGPDRAIEFVFTAPLTLAPGAVLDVKVTHFYAGQLEDFEATVYGG